MASVVSVAVDFRFFGFQTIGFHNQNGIESTSKLAGHASDERPKCQVL
jgi:hypothetical protein